MATKLGVIPRLHHALARRGFASATETPLMWKLAHGMFDPETSMAEKFPGIPDPIEINPPTPGAVEITTLPNGVRVISQDMGSPVSSLALFVGAGSRHENPYSAGVSYLLERLAFKGSGTRSKYRMVRDMERTGAMFSASASREMIAYSSEGLRTKLPDMVDLICDTSIVPAASNVQHGSFEWDSAMDEIQSQTSVMKDELSNFAKDSAGVVTEAIHAAAFHGNTLGLPLVPEERKLNMMNPQTITNFVAENFTPDRMVISAANVDHASLVEQVSSSLGSLTGESASTVDTARYTGGSHRITADGPGHIAIGFKGVSSKDEDLVPACVLYALLGGGGSFSSGGPGKGMYTRLYSEILSRHGWVSSAIAFNHCYSDVGLFGIHATCDDPAHLNNLIEVVGSQIGKLTTSLKTDELERAKAMTKSSLIMNLESRAIVCEDLGRQLLSYGKYIGPAELIKKIEAITEDDLRKVASKMLSSTPAVVTYGEEYATYEHAAIESSIKSQAKLAQ